MLIHFHHIGSETSTYSAIIRKLPLCLKHLLIT